VSRGAFLELVANQLSENTYFLLANDITHFISEPQGLTGLQCQVTDFNASLPLPSGLLFPR
jgi:hypothetical protein